MRKTKTMFLAFVALAVACPAFAQDQLMNPVIDEGATSFLTMRFKNQKGKTSTPEKFTWWLDDEETTTRLIEPTDVASPLAIHTITMDPQANQIVTDTKDFETHVVTVVFWYPDGCTSACRSGTGRARYAVRNLRIEVGTGATPWPTPASTPTP